MKNMFGEDIQVGANMYIDFKALIRDVYDYPKEGIVFKDITPLLQNGIAYRSIIDNLAARFANIEYDYILAPEARGFLVGAPLSYTTGKGLILARKPGKLPPPTCSTSYTLEYGTDTIEVPLYAINPQDRILIVDDLLATGGTAEALVKLVEDQGGQVVGLGFLVELVELKGRQLFPGKIIESIVKY